jgi:hypothetical protein
MSKLQVFVIVVALLNVVLVMEFVRRRKLLESFALLWTAVGVGGVVLGVSRPLVDELAKLVGVVYGPTLVFALVSFFLLFVCMNLSMHVSQLRLRTETLAEEIAFLRGVREPRAEPPGEGE